MVLCQTQCVFHWPLLNSPVNFKKCALAHRKKNQDTAFPNIITIVCYCLTTPKLFLIFFIISINKVMARESHWGKGKTRLLAGPNFPFSFPLVITSFLINRLMSKFKIR